MFWIPKAKREKLLTLIIKNPNKGFSNFNEPEKVKGKCRAMSIAVPAVVFFTRMQYQTLKKEERPHKKGEPNKIFILPPSGNIVHNGGENAKISEIRKMNTLSSSTPKREECPCAYFQRTQKFSKTQNFWLDGQ